MATVPTSIEGSTVVVEGKVGKQAVSLYFGWVKFVHVNHGQLVLRPIRHRHSWAWLPALAGGGAMQGLGNSLVRRKTADFFCLEVQTLAADFDPPQTSWRRLFNNSIRTWCLVPHCRAYSNLPEPNKQARKKVKEQGSVINWPLGEVLGQARLPNLSQRECQLVMRHW